VFEAVALAFGLAMDATALAAVRGLAAPPREGLILPLLFGAFQAGMSALGWAVGAWGGTYIERWDHWIAFALLAGIGVKMLFDAWKGTDADEPLRSGPWVFLALALATSIDAAAAGITLPLIPVSPWLALGLIGGVTAACSSIGFVVGRTAGRWLGGKLTALGGLILIAIGVRLLISHL
jgi:putative Mn2+ efflux pump MntP